MLWPWETLSRNRSSEFKKGPKPLQYFTCVASEVATQVR